MATGESNEARVHFEHDELVRLRRWADERAEHYRWMAALRGRSGNAHLLAGAVWSVVLTVVLGRGEQHLIWLSIGVFVGWMSFGWLVTRLITYSRRPLAGRPSWQVADYIDGVTQNRDFNYFSADGPVVYREMDYRSVPIKRLGSSEAAEQAVEALNRELLESGNYRNPYPDAFHRGGWSMSLGAEEPVGWWGRVVDRRR